MVVCAQRLISNQIFTYTNGTNQQCGKIATEYTRDAHEIEIERKATKSHI